MKPFKRILVAIDFSKYSQSTLEHAAVLARELKSEMVIVNVINQRDVNIMQYSFNRINAYHKTISIEEWLEGVKEERLKELDHLKKVVDLSGIPNSFSFKVGVPFDELFNVVKSSNIDLVVMGAKGRSDLADFLVGSTASKMFRRCPVPLVTVRTLDEID